MSMFPTKEGIQRATKDRNTRLESLNETYLVAMEQWARNCAELQAQLDRYRSAIDLISSDHKQGCQSEYCDTCEALLELENSIRSKFPDKE